MSAPAGSGPARLLCRCMGISSARVEAALAGGPPADVEQVGQVTGAGTVCGSCHSEIEELLAGRAGRPWAEARVRENRRACHAASLIRIESTLFHAVAPRLPAGTSLELISLDGLEVELHLAGEDTPALRESIAARLRKLVCPDIAVRFG